MYVVSLGVLSLLLLVLFEKRSRRTTKYSSSGPRLLPLSELLRKEKKNQS